MYKISEFAQMTGLAPSKIRFYEKNGLLKVRKDNSGYRYFTAKDAFRVNAFRVLLQYGFTVEMSIEMLDEKQSEVWFVENLKLQTEEIKKEIELCTCRLDRLNNVINLLEGGSDSKLEIIFMPDFLLVYASDGLDFSISKKNERTLSKFADLLSLTSYARIFKKEEFLNQKTKLHPSYAFAIQALKEEYLGDYDKNQVEYLSLGRCVRYLRKTNRKNSEKAHSFEELFDFLEKHNLVIRGDIMLLPTFLNLDDDERDFEILYIPIR
ncbi:MerR family transcriptional regulator [Alkalibacter mobilis]|uniref:MerR family transcriptional regulator n=1 Tax=Alkalibacter mobilis TaxID=2787712 RepID=UPI0018A08029|nr:MerR family transcriptional regulator [Alkalibacter mobilis]MBF7096449.1 MerR family transcriptional regulator [Alkalibacter mobilis]